MVALVFLSAEDARDIVSVLCCAVGLTNGSQCLLKLRYDQLASFAGQTLHKGLQGGNAIFVVSSIDAALAERRYHLSALMIVALLQLQHMQVILRQLLQPPDCLSTVSIVCGRVCKEGQEITDLL